MNKFSYADWWEGKICLVYAEILINENQPAPIRVTWNEIVEDDIIKIKEKQKEIFNRTVNDNLKKWKFIFRQKHNNSEVPELLQTIEVEKFLNITLGPLTIESTLNVELNSPYFEYNSLYAIKSFIRTTKVNGEELNLDFVHSPNFIYQNDSSLPDIFYAELCWRYVNWIAATFVKTALIVPNKEHLPATEVDEPKAKYPHPDIFKNIHAYNMFLEMKAALVDVKGSKLAAYSVIFRKLRYCDQQAIKPKIKQNYFITFLNLNYDANIEAKKFYTTTTALRTNVCNKIFEKYEALI